jgi:hypothetical protein
MCNPRVFEDVLVLHLVALATSISRCLPTPRAALLTAWIILLSLSVLLFRTRVGEVSSMADAAAQALLAYST